MRLAQFDAGGVQHHVLVDGDLAYGANLCPAAVGDRSAAPTDVHALELAQQPISLFDFRLPVGAIAMAATAAVGAHLGSGLMDAAGIGRR